MRGRQAPGEVDPTEEEEEEEEEATDVVVVDDDEVLGSSSLSQGNPGHPTPLPCNRHILLVSSKHQTPDSPLRYGFLLSPVPPSQLVYVGSGVVMVPPVILMFAQEK